MNNGMNSTRRMRAYLFPLVISLSAQFHCFAPLVEERVRIENPTNLSPQQLRLIPGRTRYIDAINAMRRAHLTGVASTSYAVPNGPLLHATTADYQSKVHIFENERYRMSIDIQPPQNFIPYGFALQFAVSERGVALLALYRDPLSLTDQRRFAQLPRLEIFFRENEEFATENSRQFSLERFVNANQGLTNPVFRNSNLTEGVFLLARRQDGAVWPYVYNITLIRGDLTAQSLNWEDAMRCSCVREYYYGEAEQNR